VGVEVVSMGAEVVIVGAEVMGGRVGAEVMSGCVGAEVVSVGAEVSQTLTNGSRFHFTIVCNREIVCVCVILLAHEMDPG
jgi:hypothetical protein